MFNGFNGCNGRAAAHPYIANALDHRGLLQRELAHLGTGAFARYWAVTMATAFI